ncbi:hypothetical protein SBA4_6330020 [Candidatus Sulfopaludibacter sp. SbA4]|nr:hypothetical protein SBA4_6330020 [Candidatus Sulfopaludibacter sp. SbA4]
MGRNELRYGYLLKRRYYLTFIETAVL